MAEPEVPEVALRAVLGLGNPGGRYRATRHNAGFLVLDRLAADRDLQFRDTGEPLVACTWRPAGRPPVILAKPSTYMNRSGRAARVLLQRHGLAAEELLVVLDDIDLPLGRMRLRPRGSAGTHNGMRSILESLGGQELPRLRVGIGPAPPGVDLADWVLEDFDRGEAVALDRVVTAAAACVTMAVEDGLGPAMNRYNAASELP